MGSIIFPSLTSSMCITIDPPNLSAFHALFNDANKKLLSQLLKLGYLFTDCSGSSEYSSNLKNGGDVKTISNNPSLSVI